MTNRKNNNKSILIGLLNLITIFSMAQNPIPGFALNLNTGCSPLTVQFTNQSSNTVSSYWDFGNGNFSNLSNPSNVYTAPGTYSIKLVEISATGQKDSVIAYDWITVLPKIGSDFYAKNTTSCLNGNVFSFVNTSPVSSTCLWDFGDGNTSALQNPNHSYSTSGHFTVKLIVHNSYGCADIKTMVNYIHVIPNPTTTFTVNTIVASNLNRIFKFTSTTSCVNSWHWTFGDGSTSELSAPQHSYSNFGTYSVSLTTSNESGCIDSLEQNNYISVTSSVTLTAELVDSKAQLNWTEYEAWSEGVDYYIIEKMNEQGNWEIIKTVDGDKLNYEVEN